MQRLILKAIDQWKQWRIDRAAKRVMPERVKLQEQIKQAERRHKQVKLLRKKLNKQTLAALRGEHGAP